jgi:hypothetical protein
MITKDVFHLIFETDTGKNHFADEFKAFAGGFLCVVENDVKYDDKQTQILFFISRK